MKNLKVRLIPVLFFLMVCGMLVGYQNFDKNSDRVVDVTNRSIRLCETVPFHTTNNPPNEILRQDIGINRMLPPIPPNDPLYGAQTYMTAIQYTNVYNFFFNSATGIQNDTVVAIIDLTGFDLEHEDLHNQKWVNLGEANGQPGIDDDNNGYIDDINGFNFYGYISNGDIRPSASHGTYVAGFLGAQGNNGLGISGVMSKHLKIMGIKTTASSDNVVSSFEYAIRNHAQFISISMDLGNDPAIRAKVEEAIAVGITIFASAGNYGPSNGYVAYPAAWSETIPGIIAVGSVDSNPANLGNKCAESSYNKYYVLSAPGCDSSRTDLGLLSTYGDPSGVNHTSYNYNHGTSFATPLMAGAAAMIYSYVRDHYACALAPAQIQTLMIEGSKNYPPLNPYMLEGKTLNLPTLQEKMLSYFPHIFSF